MKDGATGKVRVIMSVAPGQLVLLKSGMEIKAKGKPGTSTTVKATRRFAKKAKKNTTEKSGDE